MLNHVFISILWLIGSLISITSYKLMYCTLKISAFYIFRIHNINTPHIYFFSSPILYISVQKLNNEMQS